MGRNSEEDLKQTDLMRESRETMFEFLTDPDYTIWANKRDEEDLQFKIKNDEEANGTEPREFFISLTLKSDCPIILDRIREAVETNLEKNEKLTAFSSAFK
jgi:hypothetical protein